MRTCRLCHKEKPPEEFYAKGNDCKACRIARTRKWQQDNREKYNDYQRGLRQTGAASMLIREAKSRPCLDCGGSFPLECMDFDHLPGNEKVFVLAKGKGMRLARVKAEIEKCDVVCANCHRIRTRKRAEKNDAPPLTPPAPVHTLPVEQVTK